MAESILLKSSSFYFALFFFSPLLAIFLLSSLLCKLVVQFLNWCSLLSYSTYCEWNWLGTCDLSQFYSRQVKSFSWQEHGAHRYTPGKVTFCLYLFKVYNSFWKWHYFFLFTSKYGFFFFLSLFLGTDF